MRHYLPCISNPQFYYNLDSTGREPKASELNLQALNMQKDVSQVSMNSLAGKRAIIFTMDSIASYEENSLVGGAAGIRCDNVFDPNMFILAINYRRVNGAEIITAGLYPFINIISSGEVR